MFIKNWATVGLVAAIAAVPSSGETYDYVRDTLYSKTAKIAVKNSTLSPFIKNPILIYIARRLSWEVEQPAVLLLPA